MSGFRRGGTGKRSRAEKIEVEGKEGEGGGHVSVPLHLEETGNT